MDSLRLVGTMILLTRTIDQEARKREGLQDVDLNDLTVLRAIQNGYTLPSQIARRLLLDPPRITRIVDQLVSRDYVERHDDPADRRRCRLELTPSGTERLEAGLTEISMSAAKLLDQMEPNHREQLERGLESARTVLEDRANAPA